MGFVSIHPFLGKKYFHQFDANADDDFVFSLWNIVTVRDDEKLSLNERHPSFCNKLLVKATAQAKACKQSEIDKLLPALFSPF